MLTVLTIRTDKDYKNAWSYLQRSKKKYENPHLAGLKREIRWYNRHRVERRIIHDDGNGGFTEKIILPGKIRSVSAAEEWFSQEAYMGIDPENNDCAGQKRTFSHKTVNMNGRWCIYHTVKPAV